MRLLIVTSQFPLAGEPNRGRPLYQTIRELATLAVVRVVSPVATYPGWALPRSYLFKAPTATSVVTDCDVRYVQYPALPVLTRPLNGYLCARALHAEVGAFQPDVMLAYWLYPDAYGAMLAARRAGIPLVAGARGSDLRVRDPLSRQLTRPVVRAAKRLLVVSEDLGRVAARDYGADASRIRTIPNGCDASIFHPAERGSARRALGVRQDAELVVYVGRLVAEKGLRELMSAFESLRHARPRLHVVMVGDGPMRRELEQMAGAANADRVKLVGALGPDDVARWMAASNVVTLPSYSEGHPNVLVEAMACGRPVVATPVGGIPEVVDDESGILVPSHDAGALASGLQRALDRGWDATELGRKHSRAWGQVARDTLQACSEAVQESSGTRHPSSLLMGRPDQRPQER